MIYLNEWLPNPPGPDAGGEFIELYNNGNSPVDLRGWTLRTESDKRAALCGWAVPARGYLVLKKADTKLALKNTDGGLSLYGSDGRLIDAGSFRGAAPEGKSFSRVDRGEASVQQAFTDPPPGVLNQEIDNTIEVVSYPAGTRLDRPVEPGEIIGIALGAALALPLFLIYVIPKSEVLSQFFLE